MKYEYRLSEFSSSSWIDGGSFGDRHLFTIVAKNENYSNAKFEVQKRSYLHRIFYKGGLYRIITNDKNLKMLLNENDFLLDVFNSCEEDPEFSPLITGQQRETFYEIYIGFNIRKVHLLTLNSLFRFIFTLADNRFIKGRISD